MHGEVVKLTTTYGWWVDVHLHFVHVRLLLAYAFGELLVLALCEYQQEGPAFVPKYLELLSSAVGRPPHVLLAKIGVDVTTRLLELGLQLRRRDGGRGREPG